MSIALYRRYRPQTFAELIGQEHVTQPLMQALATGRVGHAYLFSGPRGCGKTTSARILARCLNCEQGPTATPCGECPSCQGLATGGPGTVDVIEIDAASHGGVDDARDLREKASYGPAQSRFKVYIIDEAHMVTPQGFNALLKIVEEPPEHVKFIFATTEPDKVIGTIRSRTHHYPFRLVPPSRLTDYLASMCEREGVAVEAGVLSFVVRAGGGSVRDSLSVLDQLIAGSGPEGLTYAGAAALLGFTEGELLDATVEALAVGDGGAVFRQVDRVIETGHDPRRFIEDLLERFRDLIIVAACPDSAAAVLRGVAEDQLDRMRQQAASYGPGELSRCADIVNAGLSELAGATSPRLQLELICARLLLPAASGVGGYAARLDRLERRLEMGGPVPTGPRAGAQGDGRAQSAASPDIVDIVDIVDTEDAQTDRDERREAIPTGGPPPVASGAVQGRTADPSPGETHERAVPSGDTPSPTPRGGLDTDAIRRSWPDVLARIFTIRRVTWTFLSEHAQVLEYDGQRLVLGIATDGLARTFHSGNHAEVVRQALSEALGVDTRIEGVSMSAASPSDSRAGGERQSAERRRPEREVRSGPGGGGRPAGRGRPQGRRLGSEGGAGGPAGDVPPPSDAEAPDDDDAPPPPQDGPSPDAPPPDAPLQDSAQDGPPRAPRPPSAPRGTRPDPAQARGATARRPHPATASSPGTGSPGTTAGAYGGFTGYSRIGERGFPAGDGAQRDDDSAGADEWAEPEGPREELAGFDMPTTRGEKAPSGLGPYAEPEPGGTGLDSQTGTSARADAVARMTSGDEDDKVGGGGPRAGTSDELGGASRDDEDISDLTAVGQPVIERVLGGVVIADQHMAPGP
ncbi:MAG: DNA polymerase III subunit gamma and tau [Dermatophilaceae bacterium]